jgi:cytochrome c553
VTAEDGETYFETHVRPLLAAHCWECHGSKKQESGLRLDSREALFRGGDAGNLLIDPADKQQSLLLQVVRHAGDLKMPPSKKLSDAEIHLLQDWIERDLPWSNGASPSASAMTIAERVQADRRDHWAFQPITVPPLPEVGDPGWPLNPIDQHVLRAMESVQLSPSPRASDTQQNRRVTSDLCGLPPDADDLGEYAAESLPDKYERLVDQRLASPRFGERWGRHWLDLARYADTKGYAFDKDRRYPFSYTYRDYVIQALNRDLRMDDFLRQQIAADLLPTASDSESLAALGFLTAGRKFNNAQDDLDDKIDVVCRGLMGITVACARCHDHKYDAVPMEDYYSLYGVFASCNEPAELPLIGSPVESAEYAKFQQELAAVQATMQQFLDERHAGILAEAREHAGDYLTRIVTQLPDEELARFPFYKSGKSPLRRRLVERWQTYLKKQATAENGVWGPFALWRAIPSDLPQEQFAAQAKQVLEQRLAANGPALNSRLLELLSRETPAAPADIARIYGQLLSEALQAWTKAGANDAAREQLDESQRELLAVLVGPDSPTDFSRDELKGLLNRAERSKQTEINKRIDALQATSPGAPPRAMVLNDNPQPVEPIVFMRGNPNRPGKSVPRQFPEVLSGEQRAPFTQGSGRRELAEAIVAERNPLTRRVLMNRFWMYHFMEPLVATPGDFGARCPQPIQATLLDYLAVDLVQHDWSMKHAHRRMVLSGTYRQSSNDRADARSIDFENRYFWRMHRRRLEFETLRDSILSVCGSLDLRMGGKSVELAKPPFAARRAVYGTIDRQDLPNLFRVFDMASPDQSNERRPRTTVPQQALFLMNSPFVWDHAQRLSSELLAGAAASAAGREASRLEPESVPSVVRAAYWRILGRAPVDEELRLASEYVEQNRARGTAVAELAQLLLQTNEFLFVD